MAIQKIKEQGETAKTKIAIIGSGNIGCDLMMKIKRLSNDLEITAMVGIDPDSDGLKRAVRMGVAITSDGIDGLVKMPEFNDIDIVFDATSALAHAKHDEILQRHNKTILDLTPAAIGPYIIPPVNGDEHLNTQNLNLVTCGGQATIPIVAAINKVSSVSYAEIIASIASKSAGPGTRANIDEFTQTTSRAIVEVGGADDGKAIIILNPAEPPMVMRDTVLCLVEKADEDKIRKSVQEMVEIVQSYVPGYRLKQEVQFQYVGGNHPIYIPHLKRNFIGVKVSVFLEVEGAAHYLPSYAGNLDIMTSSAMRVAEKIAQKRQKISQMESIVEVTQ